MKRLSLLTVGLAFCFALLAHGTSALAQGTTAAPNAVVIALAPDASLDGTLIHLEQIAKISGGSPEVRRRIARLDILEWKPSAERTTISAEQVKFRLLLAGFPLAQFRLTGARQTVVTESDEPITLRKILASAERTLRSQYAGDSARIAVTAGKSVIVPLLDVRPNDRVEFSAKVHNAVPRSGQARLDVAILINGRTRQVVPVYLEITRLATLTTKRANEGGILPVGGLETDDPPEVLIKNRDLVKIIARIGPARIEATGEALQDGKLGDSIRVRNIESNRVVFGRIEARGTVLVDY